MATFAGHSTAVAITVVQAFVLVPLCLVSLGAHLYGAWLGAAELLTWIQLFDVGIPGLVTQRVGAALGRDETGAAAEWAATGLQVLVAMAVALTGVGWLMSPLVAGWVRVMPDEADLFVACLRLGVVGSGMLLVFNGVLGVSRGTQQPHLANAAQIAGVATNLVVSFGLLLAGFGLWALPIGLCARACVSLAGGAVFLRRLSSTGQWVWRWSRADFAELRALAAPMTGASAGYLIAHNTEILLVAAIIGPTSAAVYALTRRVIDGLRNLLDAFIVAVHGGFAHLVTAHDRARTRQVTEEVLWLRLAVASVCGAVALSINQGFVGLVFGPATFGGVALSTAFVVQMIVGGHSYLSNTLLRASGRIREGSLLLLGEAVGRVGAAVAALYLTGVTGAPWASAAVSAVALAVNRRRLDEVLPVADKGSPGRSAVGRLAPVSVVAAVILLVLVWTPLSWGTVIPTAAAVTIAGSAVLWRLRPAGVGAGLHVGRT